MMKHWLLFLVFGGYSMVCQGDTYHGKDSSNFINTIILAVSRKINISDTSKDRLCNILSDWVDRLKEIRDAAFDEVKSIQRATDLKLRVFASIKNQCGDLVYETFIKVLHDSQPCRLPIRRNPKKPLLNHNEQTKLR